MALACLQKTSVLVNIFNYGFNNCYRLLPAKNYSVYSPEFIEPVYHPDEIKKLSPEERRELLHRKIKPPQPFQNASMFHDPVLQKFVNHVMQGGRKVKARQIIQEAFEKVKKIQVRKYHLAKESEKSQISTDPLELFHRAFVNCQPVLTVTPVKRGGVTYKVPIGLPEHKAKSMAYKWLVQTSREHEHRKITKHSGEFFSDRLAKEILDASQNTGKTIKKKLELHKLCETNKAYAHYRWTK